MLQIGDLAAQMYLRGFKVVSSWQYIKCNLTKSRCKFPNHQGQLITLDDLANDAIVKNYYIYMYWLNGKVAPSQYLLPGVISFLVSY